MRLVDVPREALERLYAYERLLIEESSRQSLISASTIADVRQRHLQDSLQLVPHLRGRLVLDVGSGAGLPGMVLACLNQHHVYLVEPRRRRAEFLARVAEVLGLRSTVTVLQSPVERVRGIIADTVTARAVAPLKKLFEVALNVSRAETRWVLAKGRSAEVELEDALKSWQGEFSLIKSITDPAASIVVAERVTRRHG